MIRRVDMETEQVGFSDLVYAASVALYTRSGASWMQMASLVAASKLELSRRRRRSPVV